jgi:5-histidylcysteine sulfoxide synthase/putative 4-mercaptohistidine N1-methyltranferase
VTDLRAKRVPLLSGNDPEQKREEIRQYFHNTFSLFESLHEGLASEDSFYLRADPLRHPLIFYYGHTATFFINKLTLAKLLPERLNPDFESVFAVGVDEMSWDDLDTRNYDWPAVAAVKAYRDQVRSVVDQLIATLPLQLPISWQSPFWPIIMGIEHERIHLETSSVLIRQLPLSAVRPSPLWPVCRDSGEAPVNELITVSERQVRLGKAFTDRLYGWDNEYGRHESQVTAMRASRYLVSNQEFLEFVRDDGYQRQELWTEEGWRWRTYQNACYPRFWRADAAGGANWKLRTMLEEIPMPWNWPAETNYLEAKAFCNWKAKKSGKPVRLPTEDEWYALRDGLGIPDQPEWQAAPGNINLESDASSCPVDRHRFGEFFDVIGNVWQHTETPITGFKGFKVHPLYDDFSTPTFDGKHNLIKGGSWISTGNEATRDSRYAFRRHFYQHAGIRYVESDAEIMLKENTYETDKLVSEYCHMHFGPEYFAVPNYPQACARICLYLMQGRPQRRALEIGCAVGRATFELARGFEQVTGIDFTARFIQVADRMQDQGRISYQLAEEGDLSAFHEHRLSDFGLDQFAPRTEFFQGDACNLKPIFTGYDLVAAFNLIDRLYDPEKFLRDIAGRLNQGGLLVLSSPYTWLEQFTEKKKWLGGFKRAGEPVTTLDGLQSVLSGSFRMVGQPRDVPFVIRETRRKYQHSVAQLTAWEKL